MSNISLIIKRYILKLVDRVTLLKITYNIFFN